jgi:hypothetical protein
MPLVASSLAGGEVGRFHDPARSYLHAEDGDIALLGSPAGYSSHGVRLALAHRQ